MNRDEARKRAAELNIAGRGAMTADQLRHAIFEATAQKVAEVQPEVVEAPKADGGRAVDAEHQAASTDLASPTSSPSSAKGSPRRSLVSSFTRMMSRRAGNEGESPSPLDDGRRVANYEKQNGRRFQLTPKQARRVRQKLRRTSPVDPPATG